MDIIFTLLLHMASEGPTDCSPSTQSEGLHSKFLCTAEYDHHVIETPTSRQPLSYQSQQSLGGVRVIPPTKPVVSTNSLVGQCNDLDG